MTTLTRKTCAAAAAVVALAVAGCGEGSDSPPPPPPPPPPSSSFEGAFVRSGSSIECYMFYADGTVELRHSGLPDVNEAGTYSPDSGTVAWQSGKTSTVEQSAGGMAIDGVAVSQIQTCTP